MDGHVLRGLCEWGAEEVAGKAPLDRSDMGRQRLAIVEPGRAVQRPQFSARNINDQPVDHAAFGIEGERNAVSGYRVHSRRDLPENSGGGSRPQSVGGLDRKPIATNPGNIRR